MPYDERIFLIIRFSKNKKCEHLKPQKNAVMLTILTEDIPSCDKNCALYKYTWKSKVS